MDESNYEEAKYDSVAGCSLRLFWMIVGNAILAFCAISIFCGPSRLLGLEDALYWALVGCLLAARYVDIQYFKGQTSYGDTATMADWRRYAVRLGMVSASLWLAAHAIGASGALLPSS